MPYPRFKISMPLGEVARSLLSLFGRVDPQSPENFAEAFRQFGGYDQVLLTGSGRAGFRLLLECAGFPPGSEIIFPSYTFHVMPAVAAECGLRPVFADVDPATWNISPESIRARITERTRAIVPTHLFGVPAPLEEIGALARGKGLLVIEDCAHGLGARYQDRPVGTIGDAALFTFAMSKNLPCWGGGAVVARDHALAGRMRERIGETDPPSAAAILLRQLSDLPGIFLTQAGIFPWTLYPALRVADCFGSDFFDRPFVEAVTGNQLSVIGNRFSGDGATAVDHKSRAAGISPFQAAVGLRQLSRFSGWLERQAVNARYLRGRLEDCPGLQLQKEPPGTRSSFLYVRARTEEPDRIRKRLLGQGIDTKPDDMRDCSALSIFPPGPPCPVAGSLGERCIELPCSPFYSRRQMKRIAGRIIAALG
ncbi:MAG: aminotransferase class I/II-fold pyridoxal phosphate-dependent enzyme [Candidatus Erginobacter occultus]|nr:aminotransferase class I/II-fold pyridoxal phosphate-dependent enzyme [Candidatus Erginobacter occultus]